MDDDVTPQLFKNELMSGSGNITVWINSPGGDCVAAAQIYNMLMEYPGNVTVKIDGNLTEKPEDFNVFMESVPNKVLNALVNAFSALNITYENNLKN